MTKHRLIWRMWHPVTVEADSKEEAIAKALAQKPFWIPAGTELHYGEIGLPVGVASESPEKAEERDDDKPPREALMAMYQWVHSYYAGGSYLEDVVCDLLEDCYGKEAVPADAVRGNGMMTDAGLAHIARSAKTLDKAVVLKAIDDEPEFPGESGAAGVRDAILNGDMDLFMFVMREAVRQTKKGIKDRLSNASESRNSG